MDKKMKQPDQEMKAISDILEVATVILHQTRNRRPKGIFLAGLDTDSIESGYLDFIPMDDVRFDAVEHFISSNQCSSDEEIIRRLREKKLI
jgi:hypothetical protein